MKNIVILISGRGSNMEAIVQACAIEGWPARVAAVVSNRHDASGLTFARERGIATAVVDHKAFADREEFDAELARVLQGHAPDLVVLAGFMRILTPSFVKQYEGRLVNVHPSLLPRYGGASMYDRHVHAAVLAAGETESGASVHFVEGDYDSGPVIAQARVPVLAGDTVESLAERVKQRERLLLVDVLQHRALTGEFDREEKT